MTMDKFDEVNEAEDRENARQARAARVRAAWRAHPVLVSIGVVVLLYGLALLRAFNGPVPRRGSSLFLNAGIVTAGALVFLLVRLWVRHRRARGARSDWT